MISDANPEHIIVHRVLPDVQWHLAKTIRPLTEWNFMPVRNDDNEIIGHWSYRREAKEIS